MAFLGLAGTGLLNLELNLDAGISNEDQELANMKIVSLPKLARLKTANFTVHPSVHNICAESLRGLQELTLINCNTTPLLLFRTTVMTSLRMLYIEDDLIQWVKDNNARGLLKLPLLRLADSMNHAAKTIMSLPDLIAVIGNSSIMEAGMKGLLPMKLADRRLKESRVGIDDSQRPIMIACKQDLMLRR